MILAALVAYADRRGLGDLDFEARPVDYELHIDSDGRFVDLVSIGSRLHRGRMAALPKGPPSKNNPGSASFIVDNAQYVLGTAKQHHTLGSAHKCFESYARLVQRARAEVNDEGLEALLRFIRCRDQLEAADAQLQLREAARSNRPENADKNIAARADKVLVPTLAANGHIHGRPRVVAWWSAHRMTERATTVKTGRCLVTGAVASVARTHDSIHGAPFPGMGAKLVAFDKNAFDSQHLERGANAPFTEVAARKYTEALNCLLERDERTKRRRSAIDLDAETVVSLWTDVESRAPAVVQDIFTLLHDGRRTPMQRLMPEHESAAWDSTAFYGITLGANSSRVIVRDWFQTTASKVRASLVRWFEDLHVGAGEPQMVAWADLQRALAPMPDSQHDGKPVPSCIATALFRAAVDGGALPRSVLALAVQRMGSPNSKHHARWIFELRVGLIKLVLLRQRTPWQVPNVLDDSIARPAYLLGRAFALLERQDLDAVARGQRTISTLRERFYRAASLAPSRTFGYLLSGSPQCSAMKSILSRLAGTFPCALELEEEAVFAMGYYHQRESRP